MEIAELMWGRSMLRPYGTSHRACYFPTGKSLIICNNCNKCDNYLPLYIVISHSGKMSSYLIGNTYDYTKSYGKIAQDVVFQHSGIYCLFCSLDVEWCFSNFFI